MFNFLKITLLCNLADRWNGWSWIVFISPITIIFLFLQQLLSFRQHKVLLWHLILWLFIWASREVEIICSIADWFMLHYKLTIQHFLHKRNKTLLDQIVQFILDTFQFPNHYLAIVCYLYWFHLQHKRLHWFATAVESLCTLIITKKYRLVYVFC